MKTEIDELLGELFKLFAKAEDKIKRFAISEEEFSGLSLPAINQLRYVAFHVLRANEKTEENEKKEEIIKAKQHCERAIYDATDCLIMGVLSEIRKFAEDYRLVIVADIIKDYEKHLMIIEETKSYLNDSNTIKKSLDEHIKRDLSSNKEELDKSEEILQKIEKTSKALSIIRPEINKRQIAQQNDEYLDMKAKYGEMKKNRIMIFCAIVGIFIPLLSIIIKLFF